MTNFSTKLIDGKSPRLEIDAAELKVVRGPDKGQVFALGADSLFLGSSPSCELVLHDPTISSKHAEIAATDKGYVLRDLGSTNGIRLEGWIVQRVLLADGMKVQLGETVLQVRATGKRHIVPLSESGVFGGLVVQSVKMRAFVASLERLAKSDLAVLIEGETGSGKELAAQALHDASPRGKQPFVIFDCGAVQPSLMAAELFGAEKGAYTGADRARAGLFEEAEGGTLFLDEVGELPLELQATLLGAIDRKRSRRVGGTQEISHDVRIVAATNRNLAEEVRARHFREDLFFRLAGSRVRIPPLRERREDLGALIDFFASEARVHVTPEMRALVEAHDWPGNVRELRNTIARLSAQPEAPLVFDDSILEREAHFYGADRTLKPLPDLRREEGERFERRYVELALKAAEGNVARAAELAGVSRRFLARLVARYGF